MTDRLKRYEVKCSSGNWGECGGQGVEEVTDFDPSYTPDEWVRSEDVLELEAEQRQLLDACQAVLGLDGATFALDGPELGHLQDLIAKAQAKR